jgi:DNA-binding response OmpR family regulator
MEATRRRNRKILLVDDSESALLLQRALLGRMYEVVAAVDGAEALRLAVSDKPPDLILLDVVMPKMSGLEVCRVLRRYDATKSVPIVMVTTRGDARSIDTALACGADDYVIKPIDASELLAKIRKYLGEVD